MQRRSLEFLGGTVVLAALLLALSLSACAPQHRAPTPAVPPDSAAAVSPPEETKFSVPSRPPTGTADAVVDIIIPPSAKLPTDLPAPAALKPVLTRGLAAAILADNYRAQSDVHPFIYRFRAVLRLLGGRSAGGTIELYGWLTQTLVTKGSHHDGTDGDDSTAVRLRLVRTRGSWRVESVYWTMDRGVPRTFPPGLVVLGSDGEPSWVGTDFHRLAGMLRDLPEQPEFFY
jgi:hypothetical protein